MCKLILLWNTRCVAWHVIETRPWRKQVDNICRRVIPYNKLGAVACFVSECVIVVICVYLSAMIVQDLVYGVRGQF